MTATGEDRRGEEALREEAAAWLARLRGPSSLEDHAAFEEWYAADPRHAAAYEAVLESWEIAGQAKSTPAGHARSRKSSAGHLRRRYAVAAIAATVVVVLLACGAYGAGMIGSAGDRRVEFASRAGEIRTLALADGSRVILDSGSLIQVAYSADERRVILLGGRARFAVAHNRPRPFVVATRAGLIIAHGTLFDVAIAGDRVTVSLLEGSVEIRPNAPARRTTPGQSRMLAPGQRVVLEGGEIKASPGPADRSGKDWPSGMISFENAPLGEVIVAANRYGASKIVLADPALAKLRFSGTFRPAETDNLARMLAATFDLGLSRESDGTFVLAPSRASGSGRK